jgi:hypothetical protein
MTLFQHDGDVTITDQIYRVMFPESSPATLGSMLFLSEPNSLDTQLHRLRQRLFHRSVGPL